MDGRQFQASFSWAKSHRKFQERLEAGSSRKERKPQTQHLRQQLATHGQTLYLQQQLLMQQEPLYLPEPRSPPPAVAHSASVSPTHARTSLIDTFYPTSLMEGDQSEGGACD